LIVSQKSKEKLKDDRALLEYRLQFPILDKKCYLINNSLGAMPKRVRDRLGEFADLWAGEGVVAWEKWLPAVTETANLVGSIMGAPSGSVIMHQNVSSFQGIVASAFEFTGRRNKIVYEDLNFPSVSYTWKAYERAGARVVLVPSEDGIRVDTQRMIDAIDDETLLVPMSHVLFRSSYIQDVKPIVEKAEKVGALVLLDVYQSIGAVPIDVQALGVHMVTGGSVKWLCGGPGAAYLYVRSDLVTKLRPKATGWFSHKRPFAFEMPEQDYADSVWRFMGGSPSVPALYSARSGYEILAEAGVENIRRKSLRQTALLLELADELSGRLKAKKFQIRSPRAERERGGTVCVDFDGSEAVSKKLIEQGIVIDWRPNCGIRISPHFYNTDDECRQIFDAIEELSKP
jgi:kynureninase